MFRPQQNKLDYYNAPATPAALSAASSRISLGGSPLTALLQAASIDVNEAALALANMSDEANYFKLLGRVAGQTAMFSTASGGTGKLQSTSHATKGKIFFGAAALHAYDEANERWGFGVASPVGAHEVLSLTDIVTQIIRGKSGQTADIWNLYRANTAQLIGRFDQYGIFYVVQPANANTVAQFQGNGNLGFQSSFSNSNTGASAGTILSVTTAGGGGSVMRLSTPTVAFDQSAQGGGAFGTKSLYMFSGQTGAGSYNDLYSMFPNPTASSRTRSYVGNNVNIGNREISADTLTVSNGELHNYNANPYGGEIGSECLDESTIPGAASKWNFANGLSNPGGGGALYTANALGGQLKQTYANMLVKSKPNTIYRLRLVINGASGSHYLQIYDPAGLNGTPASIKAGEVSWEKFGSLQNRLVNNGTHDFFFKTDESSLVNKDFVISVWSNVISGGFNIVSVSLKEVCGGMIDTQGTVGTGIKTISADQTLDKTAHTWLVDASAANRTVTLPLAEVAYRREYCIKKKDNSAFTVTIQAAGAENIDGANTLVLNNQYDSVIIQSDSVGWWVLANK